VLRIFPPYYALLAVIGAASLLVTARAPRGIGWMATFLTNVFQARAADINAVTATAAHLWSIAIEEQFYLVWPASVALLSRRASFTAAVAAVPLATLVRYILVLRTGSGVAAYVLMPARMDALAVGALLAYLLRSPAWPSVRERLGRSGSVPGL